MQFFYASSMFGKPRKVDSEQELYDIALRALMRRAYSVAEMKKYLAKRSDTELLMRVVMARLRERGQLDDAKYAKAFVRQRTEIRKQGRFRIARDLRGRGIADPEIAAALAETAELTDEGALVRKRIERKLKSLRGEVDERKMASIYGSLLRAGFPSDLVRRELKRMTKEELPEVDQGEGPDAER
ncbi:MAG TPA: regulatory protein RecX [Candidatus Saccharimonadales bacterium]|nr:regulatory protein RecX [Candidatus Saccharimonadales bacterium]